MSNPSSRANRLDRVIADLLVQAPDVEAAAVVSFDGLPMASALPATMDEDRVAAMSAALLSLGERAAEGLGRGALSQVYIEGEHGTVFLVSADDEAVLVAVASKGAKAGMMLYEVRRAAAAVAEVLRAEPAEPAVAAEPVYAAVAEPTLAAPVTPAAPLATTTPVYTPEPVPVVDHIATEPAYAEVAATPVTEPVSAYTPVSPDPTWPSYLPNGSGTTAEPAPWA